MAQVAFRGWPKCELASAGRARPGGGAVRVGAKSSRFFPSLDPILLVCSWSCVCVWAFLIFNNHAKHRTKMSEIISSDAGPRMDGIPAWDVWDLVTDVLHPSARKKCRGCLTLHGETGRKKSVTNQQKVEQSKNVPRWREQFGRRSIWCLRTQNNPAAQLYCASSRTKKQCSR